MKLKTKWRVRPVFSITLHVKDLALLESIKNNIFSGVGYIRKSGEKAVMYVVDSIKEIPVIIHHFDKYPLITQKLSDYLIFKQCFEIINQGNHLTERGLLEIVGLKSNLNLGLPVKLKEAFNVTEVNRAEYQFKGIPNPFWVSGFTSGEGSFQVLARNRNSNALFVRFSIHLHIRDLEVLKGISSFFKSAAALKEKDKFTEKKVTLTDKSAQLQISKFSDINNIIIPFFNKHPILGMKSLDFIDFKKVCDILKTKDHLTSTSVYNQIIEIKSGINLNRK